MNADSGAGLAWLADPRGNRIPVKGSCSLGRSASNQVAIPDDRVSRRHALIQIQGENEFWLVDFGSRNGTYLNGQRLTRPSRLQDGDHIVIGHAEFAFHQRQSAKQGATQTILADRTKADIRNFRTANGCREAAMRRSALLINRMCLFANMKVSLHRG
jgi:pSer/pThr/pTyr-binding forkhead associated (FHA) protein